MTYAISQRTGLAALAALVAAGFASSAMAVDPGVGVGKPGVGAVDPGLNQPGVAGNVGTPGVSVVDPGLNQPGVAGNVGGVARRSVRR